MSKLQLKKELQAFDAEQLRDMVLDLYTARKDFKEYFDFYLNPDVEKLSAKYRELISKELNRTKRGGYSKARISFIKNQIKEFSSFKPGYEAELDLLCYTFAYGVSNERFHYYSETLAKGIASLIKLILEVAERNLVVDTAIKRITRILDTETIGTKYFRNALRGKLTEYISVMNLASIRPS